MHAAAPVMAIEGWYLPAGQAISLSTHSENWCAAAWTEPQTPVRQ